MDGGHYGNDWSETGPYMTGAAGGGPDTAGTDPLTAVVEQVLYERTFLRPIMRRPLAEFIVAAVRAHQNTTGQQAAAKAPPTDKSWIEMEGG